MSIILDDLKARLDDARSRLILASQEYQAAGAKLQQVQNECNVWTAALGLETREEEKRLSKAMENQLPMDLPDLAEAPKGENQPLPQLPQTRRRRSAKFWQNTREELRPLGFGLRSKTTLPVGPTSTRS